MCLASSLTSNLDGRSAVYYDDWIGPRASVQRASRIDLETDA